jgi:hypothetical protein
LIEKQKISLRYFYQPSRGQSKIFSRLGDKGRNGHSSIGQSWVAEVEAVP